MKVKEIMSREVFTLHEDCPGEEAAWALRERRLGGAPVRDAAGRLVGVLSTHDLAAREGSETVGELMTPALLAVDPDDDVADACRLMLAHDVKRVIVLDADGKLEGIVSTLDCLKALVGEDAAGSSSTSVSDLFDRRSTGRHLH